MTMIRAIYYLGLLIWWKRPNRVLAFLSVGVVNGTIVAGILGPYGGEVATEIVSDIGPRKFFKIMDGMAKVLAADPMTEAAFHVVKNVRQPK